MAGKDTKDAKDKDVPPAATGSRCEQKVFQRRFNRKREVGEEVAVESLNAAYLDKEAQRRREYALVVTQVFDKEYKREKTFLAVNSPIILGVFRDLIGSHPAVASTFEEPCELESPFQMLIHHWDALEKHRDETADDDVRMHLSLLLEFMKAELVADREKLLTMRRKGQITYETLWSLFVPGQLLYKDEGGHPWLLRCLGTAYEEYRDRGPVCHVHTEYTDYNGYIMGDARHTVDILQKKSFSGGNPGTIQELPVYPLEFYSGDKEKLKAKLAERGQRFLSIKGIQPVHYNGAASYLKEPPYSFYHPSLMGSNGFWLPFTESGRVVLDRVLVDEEIILERSSVKLNADAEVMMCPPFALGFSPTRKTWCRYFLDCFADIQWKPNAWDQLLLDPKQKRVLRALVECHISPEDAREQAEQKGKGLVILLHGSPGSGKTLTAESSAEATKKILIPSSIDELNKDNWPSEFEVRLKNLLHYCTRWGAVLLLDEADVFLERRNDAPGNERRNAIVAIFLKQLEFFSGVVFLTTNRVKTFDPAMKSRIHLALGYSPPDIETRRHLWTHYLSLVPNDEISMVIDEDIEELLPERLNGREISYAVNTARTIARFEKLPLTKEHLVSVVDVRMTFDQSLKSIAKKMDGLGLDSRGTGSGLLDRKDSILHDEAADFKS